MSTKAAVSADDVEARHPDVDPERAGGFCVAGITDCPGWTAMYFGEVPCAYCWWIAPGDAHGSPAWD